MAALPVLLVALGVSVVALLRWVADDYRARGHLSDGAAAAAWLLGLTHAGLVAVAAAAGVWRVGLPVAVAVGAGVLVGGGGLVLLGRAVSAFESFDHVLGRRVGPLVTQGVYSVSRNPQAVGWGLLLTGAALAGRSLLAMSFVACYWACLVAYLWIEEEHLASRHGDTYARYARSVRRLAGRRPAADA